MTTTHTQPAGCDLDSLTRYDLFETDDGDELRVEPDGRWVRFDDVREAIARAAQAPQGDTRQGATVDLSNADLYTLRRVIECVEKMDERPRPMCRDCADENGTCPNSGLECDMGMLITSAKSIYNRLATPAAHTCTPADERALYEAWELSEAERFKGEPLSAEEVQYVLKRWTRDPETYERCPHHWPAFQAGLRARAAQGAGTAPVGAVDPAAWLDRDGHMIKELREFIEGMSVSMDVSTGDHDAGHRYFGIINEVMDDYEDKNGVTLLVYEAHPNFVTPPAPVSTAAATMASASSERPITNAEEFFAEARRLGCKLPDDLRAFLASAPSRAADGQQGASRAVLDWPHGPDEVACSSCGLTMGESRLLADLKRGEAALARAPLPAQADGQAVDDARFDSHILLWLCDEAWFQDEIGHRLDLPGTDETVEETVRDLRKLFARMFRDSAAQSRAQSDTTGGSDA